MSVWGQAYFWVLAALAVIGAIATVSSPNPIRGAMGLLLSILSVGGLFLALHAQFLAAIQLIVYAGAIVVLFLFVIMLLGPSAQSPNDSRGWFPRFSAVGLFTGLGIATLILLVRNLPPAKTILDSAPNDFGSIDSFGNILFTQALVPFELSSALLMVAVVGAVAVARGRQGEHEQVKKRKSPEKTAQSAQSAEAAKSDAPGAH